MEARLGRAYALPYPMPDLVAHDDRSEHITAARALALAHRELLWGVRRAFAEPDPLDPGQRRGADRVDFGQSFGRGRPAAVRDTRVA